MIYNTPLVHFREFTLTHTLRILTTHLSIITFTQNATGAILLARGFASSLCLLFNGKETSYYLEVLINNSSSSFTSSPLFDCHIVSGRSDEKICIVTMRIDKTPVFFAVGQERTFYTKASPYLLRQRLGRENAFV